MKWLMIVLAPGACAGAPARAAQAPGLYVATDGNDAWSGRAAAPNPGRADGPFATPARYPNFDIAVARQANEAEGPCHITFQGFTIEGCDGAPVAFNAVRDCAVVGCVIRNYGSGVGLSGCRSCLAYGNDISHTGSAGITAYSGEPQPDAAGRQPHREEHHPPHRLLLADVERRAGPRASGTSSRTTRSTTARASPSPTPATTTSSNTTTCPGGSSAVRTPGPGRAFVSWEKHSWIDSSSFYMRTGCSSFW